MTRFSPKSILTLFFLSMFLLPLASEASGPEGPTGADATAARYELKLQAFPQGSLQLSGQGSYLPGQEVLITASPQADVSFGSWSMNGTLFSRNDTIRFIMPDMDLTLEARTPRESRKHQRKMKRAEKTCAIED